MNPTVGENKEKQIGKNKGRARIKHVYPDIAKPTVKTSEHLHIVSQIETRTAPKENLFWTVCDSLAVLEDYKVKGREGLDFLSFNFVYITQLLLQILNPEIRVRSKYKITNQILVKRILLAFLKYMRTEYY